LPLERVAEVESDGKNKPAKLLIGNDRSLPCRISVNLCSSVLKINTTNPRLTLLFRVAPRFH
jgi:hypothetical protein